VLLLFQLVSIVTLVPGQHQRVYPRLQPAFGVLRGHGRRIGEPPRSVCASDASRVLGLRFLEQVVFSNVKTVKLELGHLLLHPARLQLV